MPDDRAVAVPLAEQLRSVPGMRCCVSTPRTRWAWIRAAFPWGASATKLRMLLAWKDAMQMLGNAVVPPVARDILTAVVEAA